MPRTNLIQIKKHQAEFSSVASSIEEVFLGFSERLNTLIDKTDLGIPPLGEGRQAYFAELLVVSKMATGDWLKKDKPPKPTTLRKVVVYLLAHTNWTIHPLRLEAWLKYGEKVVINPFSGSSAENAMLYPLASSLISEVAREAGIPGSSFNVNDTLRLTVDLLASFGVEGPEEIGLGHKKLIEQLILQMPLYQH